jgi:hypothetical protein
VIPIEIGSADLSAEKEIEIEIGGLSVSQMKRKVPFQGWTQVLFGTPASQVLSSHLFPTEGRVMYFYNITPEDILGS